MDAALEEKALRDRASLGLEPHESLRLAQLEDVFSDEPVYLPDLSPEESEELWFTAHRTGDPLADYWERQIARGEVPDLDLAEVPEED